METLAIVLSIVGAMFILWAYIVVLADSSAAESQGYPLFNFIGGMLISISMLIGQMNWGSFALQVFFVFVSLIGMIKNWGKS
jgi:hypothetical protein